MLASLRVRALFLVLLAVVPALGLVLYTSAEWRDREAVEEQDDLLRLARLVSATEGQIVDATRELLATLTRIPEVRSPDRTRCQEILFAVRVQTSRYANLGVTDADGEVLCTALPLDGPVDLAGRPYFQRAVDSRSFALGDYEVEPASGRAGITAASPVLDQAGRIQSVVFAALDLAWVGKLAASAELREGSTVTLFDKNGTILARYPDPEQWVGRSGVSLPIVRLVLEQGREGTAELPGADGHSWLYGFVPLLPSSQGGSIHVAVGMPRAVALTETDRVQARHFLALGLVAALTMVAAWVGSNLLLLRPLNALLTVARRLSGGDLNARTGLTRGPGELSQLGRAFDDMASSLQAREAEAGQARDALRRAHDQLELRVQERTAELLELNQTLHGQIAERQRAEAALRKLSQAVEQAGDSIFITDHRGVIEYVNPAFERLTGYQAEEVLGTTPRFLKSSEHGDEFYRRFWDTILAGTVVRTVFVNRKKDGSLYSEEKTITPIRDASGVISHFVSAGRDITERRRAEDALRKSEERHRLLLEASPDPIVVWDRTGRPTYVNPAFVRTFGWTRDELPEQRAAFVPEEVQPGIQDAIARVLEAGEGTFSFESQRLTRDGRLLDVQINGSVFHERHGSHQETIVTYRDITQRKRGEAALRRLNTALEQEARRIAQALHDDAGQFLAAVHVALDEAARDLPSGAHRHLGEIRRLLDQMEDELRRLARELRPPVLDDLGLIPALEFLSRGVSKRTGLVITVEGPRRQRFPAAVETAIYRIVQESLTNVSRHARATGVRVVLESEPERVRCSITDDGAGFDVRAVLTRRGERGLGLMGIQERLDALRGMLEIRSSPGAGTQMKVMIPTQTET